MCIQEVIYFLWESKTTQQKNEINYFYPIENGQSLYNTVLNHTETKVPYHSAEMEVG